MSVLLTGGVGYIGSHTAAVLAEAGHQVVILDNLRNSSAGVVDRLQAIVGRRPAFVRGDIRDTSLVTRTLREHRVEAVIHLAGLKAVAESIAVPLEYYSNNVQGTLSVLDAMNAAGVFKLVFSSSATVYGDPEYLPIDEEHRKEAINPYGRSKLHIEGMLFDLARSSNRWSIACLRYFNPVGTHESGLIGESPLGVPTNLMPYIAQVAGGKLPYLSVFGSDYDTPDGTGIRDFIHVMDLAEGHLAALNFLKKERGMHAFNLGTGRGYSVLEMIRAFETASNARVNYRFHPRRPGDVAASYANPDKAAEVLHWQATRSLEDMCTTLWHWQRRLTEEGTAELAWAR
ncbi:UDP-glucose 4-epimerase GalE [Rhizobium sp. RAF56]|uniref:UDP-glucose 4-epimerase GalE n=1 Tax=Rhizobium sp. RAF56 TaxID=3233062 RepID=UPI003F96CA68